MVESRPAFYMQSSNVATNDAGKRFPVNRPSPFNSQLLSIKESSKENSSGNRSKTPTPSSARSSPDRLARKKPSISLFPDPARLQPNTNKAPPQLQISIPPTLVKAEGRRGSSNKGPETANSTNSDENLVGLAKAKQRALDAKRRDSPSPKFVHPTPQQTPIAADSVSPRTKTPEDHSSPTIVVTPPNKLRRRLSRQNHRQSHSFDFFPDRKPSISSSSDTGSRSATTTRNGSVSSLPPTIDKPLPSVEKASNRLQAAADLKPSINLRHKPSTSSLYSQYVAPEEPSEPSKKSNTHGKRLSYTSKLPSGVLPEQAAKTLSSSVKDALSSHARLESMGYRVLLPHEVVRLNDDHLDLEKQIDSIKKELNSIRQQSSHLHEKMLDELRNCATTPAPDSATLTRLVHLQIDVATVEVKFDNASRRLAKTQHRRAEVRERLLMHLAGTHAMLECDKQLVRKQATPPESPVLPDFKVNKNMI